MSSGGGKSKPGQPGGTQNGYTGPERRVNPERRAAKRRRGSRRERHRRIDEERASGIGEIMDDRRRDRERDRRKDDRRHFSRRKSDARGPYGRRATDPGK